MLEFIKENTLNILSTCFVIQAMYLIYLSNFLNKFKNTQIECNCYHKFLIQLGICNRIQHAYFHGEITLEFAIKELINNAWTYQNINPLFTLLYEIHATKEDIIKISKQQNIPNLMILADAYDEALKKMNMDVN